MPIKLDLDFIFDGNPPREFVQALNFVNSKQFTSKRNYELRAAALDLGKLSDFFSNKGIAQGLGLEAFRGLIAEPTKAEAAKRGYLKEDSAPDTELTFEEAASFLPSDVVNEMAAASGRTGVEGLGPGAGISAEIKQRMTLKKKVETVFQDKLTSSQLSEVNKIFKRGAGKSKTELLTRYIYSNPQLKKRLLTIANQKIANLIDIIHVDDKGPLPKPQFFVVTGAFERLGLQSLNKGLLYLAPEVRSNGSLQFRLSRAAIQELSKHKVDITTQMFSRIADNFGNNLIKFFFTENTKRGAVTRAVESFPKLQTYVANMSKKGQSPSQSTILFLAEFIYFAAELDPTLGGKEFALRAEERTDPKNFGPITSQLSIAASKGQGEKQALTSAVQLAELVRRALKQRMPQGTPGGPPEPTPGTLTYRTGRFVNSVGILALNKRKRLINYTYDPIYRQWEEKYKSETLIESTIREVAQQQFGARYALYRRSS